MTAEWEKRMAYARGLRELAGWLMDHPEVPLPNEGTGHVVMAKEDAEGVAAVTDAAKVMGVEVAGADRGQPRASLRFGPVAYQIFYSTRDTMARYYAYTSYADAVQPESVSAP